ncbi:hypothetical protein [Granulicella sibirica]|uniref:Uncharacterized protein n=1 Tax=Granulicella sibirica TaxID=2479048 RepID=A0A4Q0SYM2_9BACT|nr:hypothetical protein [Granulicella sibirica]RXH55512.1 hypothetical protein GRAN_2369 [Granulicella sibirica]
MALSGTPPKRPRLAAITTAYKKYLHPQHVVDRLLDGYGWKGVYHRPEMDVVSLFVDQHGEGDIFQERADRHPTMKICPTIADALTLGTGKLAVDGVVVVAEHGTYPISNTQMLEGDDVWAAASAGRWSKDLLSSALSRSDTPLGLSVLDGRPQDLTVEGILPQLVKDPFAYCIEYNDGTRATLLMLNGAVRDFNISVRVADHGTVSTQFFTTPNPNQTYSACLAAKIEQMFVTKAAPYPVQRTLLTSGVLEACLTSRHRLNQRVETPHLAVSYQAPMESQFARS